MENSNKPKRLKLFGKCPGTVWENLCSFKEYPEKLSVLLRGNAFAPIDLEGTEGTPVENVHLSDNLNSLVYYINHPEQF